MLVLLAPFVGEVLVGSLPTRLLAAYPALVPMYGGGALLVRGADPPLWPGRADLLLLGAAYGVAEEGLGDMSLFNPDFLGLHLLDHGRLFGIGWVWWLDVLTLQVVWSIGVSVALAEALLVRRGTAPWVGRVGLVVAGVVFVLGVALVHAAAGEGYVLSAAQLAGSLGLILALVATALWPRRWPLPARDPRQAPRQAPRHAPGAPRGQRRAPRPWLVGVAAVRGGQRLHGAGSSRQRRAWAAAFGCGRDRGRPRAVAAGCRHRRPLVEGGRLGYTHRFALAAGGALTYVWCGLVFTGRDAVDLAGQTAVMVLAVGLLAVAARRIQLALLEAALPDAAAVPPAAPRP